MSDDDSWTVSHDMLMIDEVHTSEESENLSSSKDHNQPHHDISQPPNAFFQLGLDAASATEHGNLGGARREEMILLGSEDDEWIKVRPPRNQRKHIELKDITENDFLSLIEAKN